VIEVRREISPLAHEWDDLADRVGAPAFLRPGWMRTWWRAFGRGSLEILALRREGRLAGVLPLYRERAVVRSPSNGHTPLYEPLAEDSSAAEELAAAMLAGGSRRVGVFYLTPGELGQGALERAAGTAGYRMAEKTLEH
jgi:CelD/BcsL family acetyltransferase involved in cellulose biosynthesis